MKKPVLFLLSFLFTTQNLPGHSLSPLETASGTSPMDFKLSLGGAQDKGILEPKIWLKTGLWYPVTLGVEWIPKDQPAGGGYLQWTLYEDFSMPAIALRAGYFKDTENHYPVSWIASWGIGPVSLYFSHTREKFTQIREATGLEYQAIPGSLSLNVERENKAIQGKLSVFF
jgi:hypothetical protein